MAADTTNASGRPKNCLVLILLVSVIAHGFLFCTRLIQPTVNQELDYHSTATTNSDDFATRGVRGDTSSSLLEPLEDLREQSVQDEFPLPHWRLATDCSVYSLDCFTTARQSQAYLPYPFSKSTREVIERQPSDNTTSTSMEQDEWSLETFNYVREEWVEQLNRNYSKFRLEKRNYYYPPQSSRTDYESCMDRTIRQNKTTLEQLDILFSKDKPIITPEKDTNMVSFTIADYSYIKEMIHEVFQMMDETVGFSAESFFLVAIDKKSATLACKYGYPVVLWKEDQDNLKDAVANTKIVLSRELTHRGIDFFFTEMDVWWIESPKSHLIDFQKRHEEKKDESNIEKHFYVSGHQNNPNAPNIGVYAVKANKYTSEYFDVVLDILKLKPQTHDQFVMAEVSRLFSESYHGRPYKFGGRFEPDGPPEAPNVVNSFTPLFFSPHEIVADERPMPTHETLAIHTLNNAPLQMPHGKMMKAKELGVYYGFRSHPRRDSHKGKAAGYYERDDEHRRYIMLDSSTRTNFYSTVDNRRYHSQEVPEWTLALLIALARKTDRILILPQIFDATMDAGSYFSWTAMDYSKVTKMVDFRESNFPNNPKAWKDGDWPFETVLTTGLFESVDPPWSISIYTQASNRSSVIFKKAWKGTVHDQNILDVWVGSFLTAPELESTEILLVNPDRVMEGGFVSAMAHRLYNRKRYFDKNQTDGDPPYVGQFEAEVFEIYQLLGWCWDIVYRHTVSKVSASDSCFGIGNPRQYH